MKAIHLTEFVENYQSLKPTTIPDPSPRSDELLVNVHHAGLNYVDLLYCRGKHQNNRSLVVPPFTLGLEFAGVVEHAPSKSNFKRGDRVFGGNIGAFAEKIAVKEAAIQRIPDGWSLRDAAGMAATAPVSYGALVRIANVQKGETVLVHAAAGGLGVYAVQIAKALGATVIGTVGDLGKGKVLTSLGIDHVISYNEDGWEKKVLDLTHGEGVDVTYDSVGLIEKSIRCSKYAARILVIGFAGREGNLEKIAANRILLKSISVIGYRFGETGRRFPKETPEIWRGLTELLNKELIKPIVYEEQFTGLESVPSAMEAMAARKVFGKAIIDIREPSTDSKL